MPKVAACDVAEMDPAKMMEKANIGSASLKALGEQLARLRELEHSIIMKQLELS